MMQQDHEYVEHAERHGRYDEEIDGSEVGDVVLEECSPVCEGGLGRRGMSRATVRQLLLPLRERSPDHERVVFNLDRAPRNARGMVEFSSPFFILKPVEMARGNHKKRRV